MRGNTRVFFSGSSGGAGTSAAESCGVAVYHFHVSAVSRAAGQSAVRSAAYITGTRRVDERTGLVANYTRKAAEVLATGCVGPVNWQATEAAEKRRDAKVARLIVAALPHELPLAVQTALVIGYATWLRAQHGIVCEWAVHAAPGDPRNVHAHLLITTRDVDDAGGHGGKIRALDTRGTSRTIITGWRTAWEKSSNAALATVNSDTRVDSRSLAARGISRPPRQHQGPAQTAQIRRGQQTTAALINHQIGTYETLTAELQRSQKEYAQLLQSQRPEPHIRRADPFRFRREKSVRPGREHSHHHTR